VLLLGTLCADALAQALLPPTAHQTSYSAQEAPENTLECEPSCALPARPPVLMLCP